MLRRFLCLLFCLCAICARADEATHPLSTRDAVILGLVEGLTEFLPISSTGHLIIASHALDLESEAPILDTEGNPVWLRPPSLRHPDGTPLTLKRAADTYLIVIQMGAIIAVVFLYWGQLTGMLGGVLGRSATGLKLLRNIILACIPASALALLAEDWIDAHLFSMTTVALALVVGAVLMFLAERWRKHQPHRAGAEREPSELSCGQSLGVGCMQCLALWPGMSRSMSTIVGGYFVGLSPAKAAEFSFLVGLPILAGAAGLKMLKMGSAMITVFGWSHVILGTAVAAISAAIAIRFFVGYLGRHGIGAFAIYRILLAAVLFTVFI